MDQIESNSELNRGVYISTYGCQMNENDTERMYSLLEMSNYTPVSSPDQASLIIVNSCSIREKPVQKVFSEVGRYKRYKDKNPNVKIGVGGCVGQQEKSKLMLDAPLIDFVFGPDNIDELPSIVKEVADKVVDPQFKVSRNKTMRAKFYNNEPYHIETLVRNPGISTFVNITKGCDNFCTFCVVPFTRGRLRSRPLVDIVNDVHALVKRGVKEVTLLGQNVNSYLDDTGVNFARLLQILSEDTDIQRIRYVTSHPKDFTEELCQISQKYRSKICDYVHLPAQSGNSNVLNRMNRVYTREEYIAKVKMIADYVPGVSLSTDLIVGFPGETESEFQDTLSLIEEVPYESIYAFKYSPRPFTKAARYTDQIDEDTKSDRLDRLFKKQRELGFALAKRYEGMTLDVLVERVDEKNADYMSGRSTQNKVCHFKGHADLIGQTVKLRVEKAFPQTLHGVTVEATV